MSNNLENIAYKNSVNHLQENGLYEEIQSGYRVHHRTETALV